MFVDLMVLAAQCRFHDCCHAIESGCAVLVALAEGTLGEDRWQSFQKLRREQAYAARQADPHLARANRDAWKKIHRSVRARMRFESGE